MKVAVQSEPTIRSRRKCMTERAGETTRRLKRKEVEAIRRTGSEEEEEARG